MEPANYGSGLLETRTYGQVGVVDAAGPRSPARGFFFSGSGHGGSPLCRTCDGLMHSDRAALGAGYVGALVDLLDRCRLAELTIIRDCDCVYNLMG